MGPWLRQFFMLAKVPITVHSRHPVTLAVMEWCRLQHDVICSSRAVSRHPRRRRNGCVCCSTTSFGAYTLCIFNGEENPKNFPFPFGDLYRHVTHGSLGPPQCSCKTACRSVELFSHRVSHYFTMGMMHQFSHFLTLVTLTFDLDIRNRCSREGPHTSSLWIWRKSVQRFPEICNALQCTVNGDDSAVCFFVPGDLDIQTCRSEGPNTSSL